jgi:hypothetical protein
VYLVVLVLVVDTTVAQDNNKVNERVWRELAASPDGFIEAIVSLTEQVDVASVAREQGGRQLGGHVEHRQQLRLRALIQSLRDVAGRTQEDVINGVRDSGGAVLRTFFITNMLLLRVGCCRFELLL